MALLLIAAVAVAAVRSAGISPAKLSPSAVRGFVSGFGLWGPAVFVVICALRSIVLVVPIGVLTVAAGLAWGTGPGALYSVIGAMLGACLAFGVARGLGREFLERLGLRRRAGLRALDERSEIDGFRAVLLMRLIPLVPYDAINFGAGLSKVRFRDYARGTLIGLVPGACVAAFLGSSAERVGSPRFFAAVALSASLALVPIAIGGAVRRRARTRPEPSQGGGDALDPARSGRALEPAAGDAPHRALLGR